VIDTAFDEGGMKEKIERIIRTIQSGKLSIDEIVEDFEVSVDFVLKIKKENNL
jgi:exonuclease VII small subunit